MIFLQSEAIEYWDRRILMFLEITVLGF